MPIFRRGGSKDARAERPAPSASRGSARGLPQPRRLRGEGDPVAAGLIETAKSRDWGAISRALAGYSGYDHSSLVANLCKEVPELDDWLPRAIGDGAGDPLARAVLGARKVELAWSVRTGARAKDVSRAQFESFHAHLREAEEILYDAADLDRASVTAWYQILISGRGLQVGLPVLKRRFEAIITRCPDHPAAHRQMLQTLCKKWAGSHEQMHDFARETMRGPYGGLLATAVPEAHIERWLDLGRGVPGGAYMRTAEVRAELIEAAERSIARPDFASPRAPYYAYNAFAMAFSLAELAPQARAAFAATDGVVTQAPWQYLNVDTVVPYTHWRTKAYQSA